VIADTNLHVWFDVNSNNGQTLIVPYVTSAHDVRLRYELKVLNSGEAGSSNISQEGTLSVPAGKPKAVSSVQVTPQVGGKCEVDLTLGDGDQQAGQYSFDCGVKK
jgi:hypothetical protein